MPATVAGNGWERAGLLRHQDHLSAPHLHRSEATLRGQTITT